MTATITRGPGRPNDGYRLANGQRVPGTTTIAGRFKEAGGLIRWAWKEGLEEGRLRADYRHAGKRRESRDLYDKRDKAGEIGGHVHDAIEARIHGGEGLPYLRSLGLSEEDLERCEEAYSAFEFWLSGVDLELRHTEVAMVSEELRFGGTLDAVALINGQLCILDWKTSKGVYSDYIVQLGGYAILWQETRGEQFHGAHLLRVNKFSGAFAHHGWPRSMLRRGAELFRLYRRAYDFDRELKEAM